MAQQPVGGLVVAEQQGTVQQQGDGGRTELGRDGRPLCQPPGQLVPRQVLRVQAAQETRLTTGHGARQAAHRRPDTALVRRRTDTETTPKPELSPDDIIQVFPAT